MPYYILWMNLLAFALGTLIFKQPFGLEIRDDAKNYTEVGKINVANATDTLNFFLLEVNSEYLQPTSDYKIWIETAKQSSISDCNPQTLWNYDAPRNYFCIDHFTGIIYTTQYYVNSNPVAGFSYSATILVTNSNSPQALQHVFNIVVISGSNEGITECQNLYRNILLNRKCSREFEISMPSRSTVNTLMNEPFKVKYLVELEVNMLKTGFQSTTGIVHIGLALVVGDQTESIQFTYDISSTNTFRKFKVRRPLALIFQKVGSNSSLQIGAFYRLDNSNQIQQLFIQQDTFKFVLIGGRDYCIDDSDCVAKTKDFIKAKSQHNCDNGDPYQFIPKYGHCDGKLGCISFRNLI